MSTDTSPLTAPVTLEGMLVRLEPLSMDHLQDLAEFAFNQEIWRWMTDRIQNEADLRSYIQTAVNAAAAGTARAWATRSLADGRVIGSTRFADIQPANRTLEIGWTWLHPAYQRTGINVEAKYLQLRHAFEVLGIRRVAFKTHHHNLKSQTAIQALGAKHEGIFRNHVIMPDGSTRHSYWYSIIAEEWPEVKANLERRLQRQTASSNEATVR
jgi:N-acetyltransferase